MEENENQIIGDQVNMQPELFIMGYYLAHKLVIELILAEVVEFTKNISWKTEGESTVELF